MKFNFDGDILISGGSDKIVNVWHSYTYERIGSLELGSAVKTLDITEDSEIIIGGGLGGTVEFFNTNGGTKIGSLLTEFTPFLYQK